MFVRRTLNDPLLKNISDNTLIDKDDDNVTDYDTLYLLLHEHYIGVNYCCPDVPIDRCTLSMYRYALLLYRFTLSL